MPVQTEHAEPIEPSPAVAEMNRLSARSVVASTRRAIPTTTTPIGG